MQPLSGNQRPDLLTALMNMSLVLPLPRKMHLCDPLQMSHACQRLLEMLQNPYVFLTFGKVQNPLRLPRKTTYKWSEHVVLLTFWLGNVLRATTACTFLPAQLPKVLLASYIFTSKCASRHNCVQFFISHLARWLRTRRFSEPTFRPSWAPKHWKNTAYRDFSSFLRTCIFFPLALSLLWSSLFFSSLWLFPPLLFHIVGSPTSKL